MQTHISRLIVASVVVGAASAMSGCAASNGPIATTQPTTRAAGPMTHEAALVERVKASLVVVRYTFNSEVGRRDLEGIGTIVDDNGLVAFSVGLTPAVLPDEQMVDFKVVVPPNVNGNIEEDEHDATFLGRDERSELGFVRVKDTSKGHWPALHAKVKPIAVGESLYSVGLLPKSSGYAAYVRKVQVSANLRGPVPLTFTAGGLTTVGSPVFDAAGDLVAFVPDQERQMAFINAGNDAVTLSLPPMYVVGAADYMPSLNDPPTAPGSRKLPWLGVVEMTGLTKEVAHVFGLEGTPAIQVGDVVPGAPAETAGIHGGDIITAVDGHPLERGDQPDELPAILSRRLLLKNVGDEVTFSVVRERGKPPVDVKVKLAERPAAANTAARYYAEDLGFTTRDLVFGDRYARHLDPKFAGVAVTFVKEQGNAAAGGLKEGDVVTKINQTDVTDVKQFQQTYKDARAKGPKAAVVLEVLRGSDTQIIRIQPPQ